MAPKYSNWAPGYNGRKSVDLDDTIPAPAFDAFGGELNSCGARLNSSRSLLLQNNSSGTITSTITFSITYYTAS